VTEAIGKANQETGGAVLEMAETEFIVRASGYLKTLNDFRAIPLKLGSGGVPVNLGDVATIQLGPECAVASPNSTAKARRLAAW
jgi:copper/silver efflux system protein